MGKIQSVLQHLVVLAILAAALYIILTGGYPTAVESFAFATVSIILAWVISKLG